MGKIKVSSSLGCFMKFLCFLVIFLSIHSTITKSRSVDLELEGQRVRFPKPRDPLNAKELEDFIDRKQKTYPSYTEIESYDETRCNLEYFLARAKSKNRFEAKHYKLSEGLAKLIQKRGKRLFKNGFIPGDSFLKDVRLAQHFIDYAILKTPATDPRRPNPFQKLHDYKKKLSERKLKLEAKVARVSKTSLKFIR